jgi:glycosyl transferase family 25
MKSFVINLRRRPDRLQQFFDRCPLKDVEVIPAFDGLNPNLESVDEQMLFHERLRVFSRPGERGVFISHLRIWKQIVKDSIPHALIFEDDAQFNEKFLSVFQEVKNFKGPLVFLGGRFEDNFVMPKKYSKPLSKFLTRHLYQSWEPKYHDRTAHAYIISQSTAKILIDIFENGTVLQLDHFITKCLRDLGVPVYSSVPLVCWSPLVGDSDIR